MQSQITTDIGTEPLFENERIRVWQMILQPGEESPHHFHEGDYVFIYTTPSRMTAFLEGSPPPPPTSTTASSSTPRSAPARPSYHIRNDGTVEHRQILVEFKGPSPDLKCSRSPKPTAARALRSKYGSGTLVTGRGSPAGPPPPVAAPLASSLRAPSRGDPPLMGASPAT